MRIYRTNTILYCDRWEETVHFYREVLKLRMLMDRGWFVEFQLSGSACLSVADAAHASIASAGGSGITLSWQVENLEAVYDRMVSDGLDVAPIQATWGARTCFVFDPEGNRIELWA